MVKDVKGQDIKVGSKLLMMRGSRRRRTSLVEVVVTRIRTDVTERRTKTIVTVSGKEILKNYNLQPYERTFFTNLIAPEHRAYVIG